MHLPYYQNILLIAGSGRNIGKTTLAEAVIKKYASSWPIIGLKASSVYAGEDQLHGKKPISFNGKFDIMEELDQSGRKDTSRFLQAGARQAFYVRAMDDQLQPAIEHFFRIVPAESIIVCESGSLRSVLVPGLFVLLKGAELEKVKTRMAWLEPLADKVFEISGNQLDKQVEQIIFNSMGWALK